MLKTDFTDRVVVITGSGCALDAALIKAFADNGAKVAFCSKPADRPASDVLDGYEEKVKMFDLYLGDFETEISSPLDSSCGRR